jgi:hypothetical protein
MDFLQANTRVFAEEFDGETVLIDVENGLYFSLAGAAADLWRSFTPAREPETVVAAMTSSLQGADPKALQDLMAQMQAHGLLVSAPPVDSTTLAPLVFAASHFQTPVLQVFSDLAELIVIDPVHEVDAAGGWPMRPAGFPDVA